jgi:hypothetical protein
VAPTSDEFISATASGSLLSNVGSVRSDVHNDCALKAGRHMSVCTARDDQDEDEDNAFRILSVGIPIATLN